MSGHSSSRVANGLRITLIHEPEATRAAALFRLSAGSLDEPARWPGLAHLLEHVLFAGSVGYQHEQRLMAWAPAHGARLNATTLAHFTAWFVEIAPERLAQALCRLSDMLARPLLATAAITAEAAAIEAEYRMLQSHGPTLCETALSQAFAAPHPLHDFHVGSQRHFGDDTVALQQALRDWHQCWFHSGKLELWLSGPQPLQELEALAEETAAAFARAESVPAAPPLLQLAPQRAFALQSAAAQHLQLSFLLNDPQPASLTLLRELLTDQASGSLLATLREQGLCDNISLLEPYRSARQSVASVRFQLNGLQLAQCARIETLFRRWLAQLSGLTQQQRAHYASLTQRRFSQLSPLDRLRDLALGFPPAQSTTPLPLPQSLSRLWVSPAVSAPVVRAQGFSLRLAAIDWPQAKPETPPALRFYSPASTPVAPALPIAQSALAAVAGPGEPTLLLSIQPGLLAGRRTAALIEAALQPAMGDALHGGGELAFSRQHGLWQLRLSGHDALLAATLDRAIQALTDPPAATQAFGERLFHQAQQADDIAIRCLLARLPDLLNSTSADALSALRWQATLYGGADNSAAGLARRLTRLPGTVEPAQSPPQVFPTQPHYSCPTAGGDAAVLTFCPLAEASAVCFASWQLLAALFEPRFFQRLRVEANVGYVVSCRFHQTAGQAGLLFALQSPALSTEELFGHIDRFIADMAATVESQTTETLAAGWLSLLPALPENVPKNRQQITPHWLYQQLNLPFSFARPSPDRLRLAYQQLTDSAARWWRLSNSA
ncbi:pyrroloquinoline quinone biosynthesis protein PqqF [Erwinia sp. 198]|uniref:pyrroloquinoline quinone biosynthesis protein PqqF n=1 Tax=Erwinia sp. 198 TaxID=2022746 RepID=UPI000F669A5F|nr:pyrroloquinoline quinone biosynthesis protein PqqF [Erwinia sp. 198]RRZ96953.1 pyrroloquinoline quinone biosynthesis protein PqqF [Erwinia sp. 198]